MDSFGVLCSLCRRLMPVSTAHKINLPNCRARADIVAGQAFNLAELVGLLDAAAHPRITALLEKLKARPAFARVFHPDRVA